METPNIFIIDAFADNPFSGNPAGVALLKTAPPDEWMQGLAAELKHSETAFAWPEGDTFRLRWFTPEAEVPLCGHATLATAHALWSTGVVEGHESVHFETKCGRLTCTRDASGEVHMDFPVELPEEVARPEGFLEPLGLKPEEVTFFGASRMGYLLDLTSEHLVRALRPELSKIPMGDRRALLVTARADAGSTYDIVSRVFIPSTGTEDPVTGRAHCGFGPYWAKKLGRDSIYGYQASRRGGAVRVSVRGDRVILQGKAVTILEGVMVARQRASAGLRDRSPGVD